MKLPLILGLVGGFRSLLHAGSTFTDQSLNNRCPVLPGCRLQEIQVRDRFTAKPEIDGALFYLRATRFFRSANICNQRRANPVINTSRTFSLVTTTAQNLKVTKVIYATKAARDNMVNFQIFYTAAVQALSVLNKGLDSVFNGDTHFVTCSILTRMPSFSAYSRTARSRIDASVCPHLDIIASIKARHSAVIRLDSLSVFGCLGIVRVYGTWFSSVNYRLLYYTIWRTMSPDGTQYVYNDTRNRGRVAWQ